MGMRLNPEMMAKCLALAGEAPRPLVDTISEKDFDAAIVELAKANGWLTYHTRDSRKSESGFPDRVFVRNGRLIFAELKVPPNVPSAAQQTWIEELSKCNPKQVIVAVWMPRDWPDIASVLTAAP